MKFTKDQWTTLSERFNKQSFLGKLMIIKNNSDIFYIQADGVNVRLRLHCEESMREGYDLLFSFCDFFSFAEIRDVFSLIDIKVKEL